MVNRPKKVQKSLWVLLVFLVGGSFSTTLLQAEERIYLIHRLTEKPVLDGRVSNDPAWRNVPQATDFVRLGGDILASKQTFFQIGFSAEALYIGIRCEEPEIEKIVAELRDEPLVASHCRPVKSVSGEDSIVVCLFPKKANSHFQFAVNALGSRWDAEVGRGGPLRLLWNWQTKTYLGKDYWSAEIRIPFEVLPVTPEKGERWAGNITRNIFTPGEDRHTTWAHLEAGLHEPENLGRFFFAGGFSATETRKARKKIISNLKEEITANLKSLSDLKEEKETARRAGEYLSPEAISFLKNYQEVERELSPLDTTKKACLLFQKSENLLKEADELERGTLLEDLFRF